jgi:4'-phosphopantetheinyl transferase
MNGLANNLRKPRREWIGDILRQPVNAPRCLATANFAETLRHDIPAHAGLPAHNREFGDADARSCGLLQSWIDRLRLSTELVGFGVDVWIVRLSQPNSIADYCNRILSSEERYRAAQFISVRDRHRFILRRGALRLALSEYVKARPEEHRFACGRYGKPALISDLGAKAVHFSVSYSNVLAVIGVSTRRDIGIDVERIREMPDLDAMLTNVFGREESHRVMNLPPAERSTAFFRLWTRKEAVLKGGGVGLFSLIEGAHPLSAFQIRRGRGIVSSQRTQSRNWSVYEFVPLSSYLGAVAVEGHEC